MFLKVKCYGRKGEIEVGEVSERYVQDIEVTLKWNEWRKTEENIRIEGV